MSCVAPTFYKSLACLGLKSDENWPFRGGSRTRADLRSAAKRGLCCAEGIKPLTDLFQARPRYLLHHLAIAQEHKVRPKLDVKGSSERFPFAIFHPDVLHRRIILQ